MRVVPHYSPTRGLRFSILLRQHFSDAASARYALERLDLPAGTETALFSKWSPDTIFFADPYRR